jgi:hypothetical protein
MLLRLSREEHEEEARKARLVAAEALARQQKDAKRAETILEATGSSNSFTCASVSATPLPPNGAARPWLAGPLENQGPTESSTRTERRIRGGMVCR